MAAPASRCRLLAVTFLVLPVALLIDPLPARTDTLVAVKLPKATLVPANKRRAEPVAPMLLLPNIRIAPLVASRWMVPANEVLMSVAVAPKPTSMSSAAWMVIWPESLLTLALMKTFDIVKAA